MAHEYLRELVLSGGLVTGGVFHVLEADDLPRPSPDPSGGYTLAAVTVDQYGRVVAAADGSQADLALLNVAFTDVVNDFTVSQLIDVTVHDAGLTITQALGGGGPTRPGLVVTNDAFGTSTSITGGVIAATTLTLTTPLEVAGGGTGSDLSATGPGLVYQATAGAALTVGTGVVYTGGGLQFSNGVAGLDANSARMGGRLFDNFLDIVGISATASSASDRVVKVYDIVECGRFRGAAGAGYLVFDRSAGSDGIYFGEDADTGNSYVRGTGRFEITAGGNSGARARVGGTIFDHYADAGNSTTAETDLVSDTIASSVLASNGDKLEGEYGGVYVSSATATRQIKLYFAGTAIFDTGALTLSLSSAWTMYVTLIRVSATVVRYMVSFTTEGAALAAYTAVGELTGLTLSNSNILKVTGQAAGAGAASSDIVSKMASVAWRPAAA